MKFEFQPSVLTESKERKAFFAYWLRRIFLDDWLMKIVALLVTIALWLGVSGLRTPTSRTISNVSLSALVAPNLEITNTLTPEIDIEVTGDKEKVNTIDTRQLSATIDLTDLREGDRTIQLTPQGISVGLPNGVNIVKVNPEKIVIKLEKITQKEVPVRIETNGDLESGFEIYSKTATPSRVKIRGPESFVKALSFVTTEKVEVSGRKNGFVSNQVPLSISDNKISFVDDVTASVSVRIGLKRTESIITVPFETEDGVKRAVVTLYGPRVTLEELKTEDVVVAQQPDRNGKLILSAVLPEYADSVVVKSVRQTNEK